MIHYILLFFIFLFLIFYGYVKIKYPFWSCQPVFHNYDFFRMILREPFIINKNNPMKTKFCNFFNVRTNVYLDCKENNILENTNLIQCFYLNTDRILFTLNKKDLDSIFSGHIEPPFLSIYFENEYKNTIDLSGSLITKNNLPIGSVSSRALNLWYVNNRNQNMNYVEMKINFVDYLCVNRKLNQKKVYRELLQTHEYNTQILNKNVQCSLIKKEIELFDGIIPFVNYNTLTYKLRNNRVEKLPTHTFIIKLEENKMDVLIDFLYTNNDYCMKTNLYDVLIFPDIGNIEQMIKQDLLYVYCLRNKDQIYGFYFFKDAKMYYEELECNTLHFVGSIMNCLQPTVFFQGFLHSIKNVLRTNDSFGMLLFENIGHNHVILPFWNTMYAPVFVNKTAYYLYNFVYPGSPLLANRVFVLH